MTASSSPSASSPPSSLVMNGNGQPIIVNGGSGGELIGNINNNNNNINNNNNNNNSSLEMNSTPVSNGSIDFDHKVPNGGNGSARCNGSNNNNNNNSTAATTNSNCAPSQPLLHTESTVAEKSAAKTGPSAFKRPRDFLVLCLKHLFIAIVHLIVVTYTYLTLPIYTVLQEPSEIVKKAQLTRAKQTDPNDLYSPWVCDFGNKYPYILDKVKTIDEMVSHLGEYFSLDRRALGYRRVLREYIVYGPDGKTPLRIDGRVVKKRELSDYQFISFEDMIRRKNFIARGLHLAGVKQHDKIVILCETCAEYLMMELAIANAGAVQVNVFSTLGDSGIAHAINETKAKFIFTSFELLGKTRSIIEANKLDIQKVFYIKQRVENPTEDDKLEAVVMAEKMGNTTFVPLDGIERDGELRGKEVESQCKPLDKDEIAFIMYTSGTTGVPKGVQATSYQFVQLLHAILPVLAHIIGTSDRHLYVAYLPQAHIFEATCEFLAVALGAPIGFANPFTLSDSSPGLAKGTLSDMRLLKPTIMIAVPLVLERMRKEIFSKLEARSPISAPLFNYLMDYKIRWTAKGYKTPIVNKLLCEKIREQFGGNLQKMILGGAPLSASLQALINAALDLKLVQGYGMTETLGACLCMDDDDLSYGRCGRPLRGVYARLEDWHEGGYQVTDSPRARGELIIGSKANSLSYLDKPEMNAELYEYDAKLDINWFRTGDIAEVYEDGTFKIIDRKKDLVKLANGEYFSLGKIESILKNCSYVDNICVFGNALANYLVALVVPNQNRFGRLAKSYRVPRSEWNTDTRLINLVHKSLRETGLKNGLKKAEIPTKIRLVSDEWTPDNGLLTAAMKLKRSLIKSRYEYIIQELFTDPDKTD